MRSPLQGLSASDMKAVAKALQSGRLTPPFSLTSVRRYCSGTVTEEVVGELQRLDEQGMSSEQVAFLLEVLADERAGTPHPEDLIDLVWTGPEGPGTASRDTNVVVRELFSNAQESVLMAGYAVYQGKDVFRALAERMDALPQLQVKMFLDIRRPHKDQTATSQLIQQFAHRFKTKEWPGERLPELLYYPRSLEVDVQKKASLHAKCIVVDGKVSFVSSANFTEAAQVRNIEVGVLIRSDYFSTKLQHHFQSLADARLVKRV